MHDKIFRTTITILFGALVFLLWMGLDVDTGDFDDPNIVSIEYECDKLTEYKQVPNEVVEECKDRNNTEK
jgi:hypothetical protein